MKAKKVFLGASAFGLALAMTTIQVHADDSNAQNQAIQETLGADIPAIYVVDESLDYPLNLVAEGKGSLLIGDIEVKNAKSVYSLKADKSVTVKLKPEAGNSVTKVELNGQDITSSVKGDSLTVKGVDQEQTLKVTFTNLTLPSAPAAEHSTAKQDLPSTGDRAGAYTWTGLAMAVLSLLALALSRRKNKEKEGETS